MGNQALVVIDLQNDITKNYKDIIASVNKAIEWAVNNGVQVAYVKHNNVTDGTRTFKPNTRGEQFVPELNVVNSNVFTKTKSNALTCPEFATYVQSQGISEFFVVGADATACVKSTCFNLTKAGYAVTVFADCVTSYDKSKIDQMLAYYQSKGCKLRTIN